jgi:hypothetical protein
MRNTDERLSVFQQREKGRMKQVIDRIVSGIRMAARMFLGMVGNEKC